MKPLKPFKWTRVDNFNCRIAPILFFILLIGGSLLPGRFGEIIRYSTAILVACLASYCLIYGLAFGLMRFVQVITKIWGTK